MRCASYCHSTTASTPPSPNANTTATANVRANTSANTDTDTDTNATHPHRHPTPPPTANTFVVVSTQGRTSRQSPCETLTMPAKRKSVAERRAKAPCTDVVDAVAFTPLRSMSDVRTLFKNTAEPTDVKAEIEGEAVSVVNDDGHDAHVGAAASGSLPKEEARCPIVATGDVLAKPALATPSPSTLPPTDLEECLDAYVEDACGIRVTAEDMREFETRLASARTIADSEAARQDPKLSELEELAVTGVFDIRDKVGQKWSRLVTKDAQLSKDYAACVSRESKKNFREAWAKKEYSQVLDEKRKSTSYVTVDVTRGTYKTLGAVINHLGGWQWGPAIVGAKTLAAKCARLGGKWHKVDEMTGLSMFLVLEQEYSDTLTESWEQLSRWVAEKQSAAPSTNANPDRVAVTSGSDELVGQGPRKKAKSAVTPPHDKTAPKTDPAKAKLTQALKGITKCKADYIRALASAQALIDVINAGKPEYKWARNPENLGVLREKKRRWKRGWGTSDKN